MELYEMSTDEIIKLTIKSASDIQMCIRDRDMSAVIGETTVDTDWQRIRKSTPWGMCFGQRKGVSLLSPVWMMSQISARERLSVRRFRSGKDFGM